MPVQKIPENSDRPIPPKKELHTNANVPYTRADSLKFAQYRQSNPSVTAAPANDACTNATSLGTVSTTTTVAGTNAGATSDQSIPSCWANTYYNVWYTFTAGASGCYNITIATGITCCNGGGISGPQIAIYSGSCGTLNQIACTTSSGTGSNTSITLSTGCLIAGTTYYINVDNYFALANSYPGSFNITVATGACAVSNDCCSGAAALTLGTGTVGTLTGATISGDPVPSCKNVGFGYAVWYSVTIPGNGNLTVNVTRGTVTYAAVTVYGQCSSDPLQLGCNSPNTSTANPSVTVSCLSAGTYYIMVWTDAGSAGTFTVTATYASASGASNDCCTAATSLSLSTGTNVGDYTGSVTGNNTGYTADGGSGCFLANKSAWYTFTAPVAGNYGVILTAGTMTYPELSVLTGSCGNFTEASCAGAMSTTGATWDSDNNLPVNGYSPFSLFTKYYTEAGICNVAAGQIVYVMVDNYATGAAGTFTLTVATLGNDNPSSAIVVNNCGTTFNSSTIGATNCGNGAGTPYYTGGSSTLGIMNNLDGNTGTICNGSAGASGGNILAGSCTGAAGSAADASYCVNGADVGYSVENDSWYQFCVTASTTVTATFSPVTSSCLPASGLGGTSALQISIFTGSISNFTKVDGGFCGMNVTSSFTSTYTMSTNMCSYIEVDGYGGTNCNYSLNISMSPSCVLPIELLGFTGILTERNIVKLNWSSATEKNTRNYIIEKSRDGKEYFPLTEVKAAGNSESISNYSAYDNNPFVGLNYYKLSAADLNGASNFLSYAVVTNNASLPRFEAYPNPTKGLLNVSFGNISSKSAEIEIYNGYGNMIWSSVLNADDTGNASRQIDISGFDPGIYFIKASEGENVFKKSIVLTRDN